MLPHWRLPAACPGWYGFTVRVSVGVGRVTCVAGKARTRVRADVEKGRAIPESAHMMKYRLHTSMQR